MYITFSTYIVMHITYVMDITYKYICYIDVIDVIYMNVMYVIYITIYIDLEIYITIY